MTENTAVSPEMADTVRAALRAAEHKYQVRVLWACESGSRGWGFASPDSDYDVRFIYVHAPEWYLRVQPPRDVIEEPIDSELDIAGWELRKALGLMQAANPTLMEWLDSPIVYRQDEAVSARLQTLAQQFFDPLRTRYHYLAMAKKNFRGYLQGEQVRLKKYFYVLRPLLAVRWIEAGLGQPPMRFDRLMAATVQDPALRAEIEALLAWKRKASEAQYGPRRERLHAFIHAELTDKKRPELVPRPRPDTQLLDRLLFYTVLANNPSR